MITASDALLTAVDAVAKESGGRKVGNISVAIAGEDFDVTLIDLPRGADSDVAGRIVTVSRQTGAVTRRDGITVAVSPYGEQVRADTISGRQAFERALAAVKGYDNYDKNGPLTVALVGRVYKVTFPVLPAQQVSRGPDYAFQVWVDAATGQVVKVLVAG